ncbi:SDR family oxidoreductase [Piscirickettsia litoralis]|uniref:Oxidoreductase n=1 Tax=Piscirickettsia litoralis TaxID=1891921 RepID=A0ABX3A473_9GAMM|nr:SDR family oxidoreductase [Piscirickettsia litoralis]ODN43248.1 oxidoreductase [Piscirickettsia litoralis]
MSTQKPLAIITGASSGIGRATAIALAKAGHPLLLIARRVDVLNALNLPNTIAAHVDVTDLAALKEAVNHAESEYGPADLLINNAGVMLLGQIDEQNPSEWQTMLNVNVQGVLNGVHTVIANMKSRNSGTIVNISSIAGRKTFPAHAAYVGTKFAVHGLTENIREEVSSSNVRVITIAPGAVETELLSHTTSDQIKDNYNDWKKEMGGVLAAEDVVNSILFAYQQPQNVCIREIVLAATRQQA